MDPQNQPQPFPPDQPLAAELPTPPIDNAISPPAPVSPPDSQPPSPAPPAENLSPTASSVIQPDQNSLEPPSLPGPVPIPIIASSTSGFSQADALALERKAQFKKRIFISIGVVVILVGLLIGVLASGLLSSWKTITYDNGKGSKYTLSFYSRYEVKNLLDTDKTTADFTSSTSPSKKLVSKVSKDKKYPLTLYITSVSFDRGGEVAYRRFQTCPHTAPKAFSVHNDYANSDVNLCAINQDGKDIIYIGVFKDKTDVYLVMALQDIDYSKALTDPKSAQKLLDKLDLKVYQSDLEKIIGSIKPAD